MPARAPVKAPAKTAAAQKQAAVIEQLQRTAPVRPQVPAGFSWDQLPPAEARVYATTIIDVEADTPDTVKAKVLESYNDYMTVLGYNPEEATVALKNKAVRQGFKVQRCPTPGVAAELWRLMRRYCANREPRLTLRGGVDKEDQTLVYWLAKPYEARS